MEYEAVIGLEVHVQLKTRTKMFTRAPYRYGAPPNTLTDPVVLALPGVLPVLNKEAIRQVVRMGRLFGCAIARRCKWDRKNYFYPDLPKNYQLSQYDRPLCERGEVEIELPGPARNIMGEHKVVRLTRIHLEEDPAKLTHGTGETQIDYNRCGVPLAEIVSEPDLRSSEECVAFLNALRMNLANAGISDCDMEKGQLRCDANVSIRPAGSEELNTRTEMKNLNSVSAVKAAVEFEVRRQRRVVSGGGLVVQETRRYDMEEGTSTVLRTKEEAHDYRYFPDPDLMPVELDETFLVAAAGGLPETVFARQRRFFEEYGLPYSVTSVLCPQRELADYFEEAAALHDNPKAIANLVANDLLRELGAAGAEGAGALPIGECPVKPVDLAGLVKITDAGTISKQAAREVLSGMFRTGKSPAVIVEEKGLAQTSDTGELEGHCREAIANNPKAVEQFLGGKEKALNAVKGQVMKATRGQANPQVVDALIRKLIGGEDAGS